MEAIGVESHAQPLFSISNFLYPSNQQAFPSTSNTSLYDKSFASTRLDRSGLFKLNNNFDRMRLDAVCRHNPSRVKALDTDSDDEDYLLEVIPKLLSLEKLTLQNDLDTCLSDEILQEDGMDLLFERASLRACGAERTLTSLRTLHLKLWEEGSRHWDYKTKANVFLLEGLQELILEHMTARYPLEIPISFRAFSKRTSLTILRLENSNICPQALGEIARVPRGLEYFSLHTPNDRISFFLMTDSRWTLEWYLDALKPQEDSLSTIKLLLTMAKDSPVRLENFRALKTAEFDLKHFARCPWWDSEDSQSTIMSSTLNHLILWVEPNSELLKLVSLIGRKRFVLPKLKKVTLVVDETQDLDYEHVTMDQRLDKAFSENHVLWRVRRGEREPGIIKYHNCEGQDHRGFDESEISWSSESSEETLVSGSPPYHNLAFKFAKGSVESPLPAQKPIALVRKRSLESARGGESELDRMIDLLLESPKKRAR